jgi:hypothetical protein
MTISFQEFMNITEPEMRESPGGWSFRPLRPSMVLEDGTILSVQASENHYCEPRENDGPYTMVEIGFPKRIVGDEPVHTRVEQILIDELMEWAEPAGEGKITGVFGYVPVSVLIEVINSRGGIVGTSEGRTFRVVGEKLFP